MTPMPTGRTGFVRFIIDHNPFYLLSAVCMLAGCLMLTNSMSWSPSDVSLTRLLVLIVTLNVYELLLVALGLFLIVRRGIVRDGMILLVLEVLFLVDIAFLYGEVCTLSETAGAIVNTILLVLGAGKVYVIFRVMGLPLRGILLPFVLMQLMLLLAMPVVFERLASLRRGYLDEGVLYAAWWVVSAIPAAYLILRGQPSRWEPGRVRTPAEHVGRLLLVLPLLSLVAHLCTSNWVYKADFYLAYLAPALLAMAMLVPLIKPSRFMPAQQMVGLKVLLPVLAMLLSLDAPGRLGLDVPFTGRDLTPAALALAGAYGVWVYLFALEHWLRFLAGGAAAAALVLFGPSWQTLVHWADGAWVWTTTLLARLIPRTRTAWGIVSVVAAFVLLALGALASLAKRPAVTAPPHEV